MGWWMSRGLLFNEEADGGTGGGEPSGEKVAPTGEGGPSGTPTGEGEALEALKKEYEDRLKGMSSQREKDLQEMEILKKRWEATQRLVRGDSAEAEVEESVKYLLRESGYSDEEIQGYLEGQKKEGSVDEGSNEKLEAQVKKLEAQQAAAYQDRLMTKLQGELSEAVNRSTGVKVLLEKAAELQEDPKVPGSGKDRANKAKALMMEEIQEATLRRMRERRSRGETFREEWIGEEAGKAVESVVEKYRTVIGPLDRIGLVSETVSGPGSWTPKKEPVKPPQWKKGMNTASAGQQLREFAEDFLGRAISSKDSKA